MPHVDVLREAAPIVVAGLILLVLSASLIFAGRWLRGLNRAAISHQTLLERELQNGKDPNEDNYVGFRDEITEQLRGINEKLTTDHVRLAGHDHRLEVLESAGGE
jgi:hypothetical protein